MNLVNELKERGLVQEVSGDIGVVLGETRTVYIGTDPTADSLHVGHLAWVLLLKRLAAAGHKIVLLVGGGTGMIGDPKEKGERVLMSEEAIDQNAAALSAQLSSLLGPHADFTMVNNAEWLREVKLLPFLRDVGKHFTVNDLVKRDLIKRRLADQNDSISYTEFTYSLLQAYDFWELNRRLGVDLQVGASDQWTNILSGVDLIRKREGKEVFALAIPLITDAAGKKFGKSEGNAVWLNPDKFSPYQFYQFWLNAEDTKVMDYLKIYTELSLEEIGQIAEEQQQDPGSRLAQKRLAEEVTSFVHGEQGLRDATVATAALFSGNKMAELSPADKEVLLRVAPTYQVKTGEKLVDIVTASVLASSKREAREFIESGAVSVDGEKQTDSDSELDIADVAILKRGKKNAVLLVKG
jgi:tyrosyl-tRNA synthetase